MLINTDFKIHFEVIFSANSGKVILLAPDHSHSDGPLVSGSQNKMNRDKCKRDIYGEELGVDKGDVKMFTICGVYV